MELYIVRFLHLVAVAIWVGGLVTLAALVVALRKAGADIELLRASARQFARLSWTAMLVAIVTGVLQVQLMGFSWSDGALHTKLGLVALVLILAGVHQVTAKRTGPALRGVIQVLIMLVSLCVVAAAVVL